MPGPVLAAAIPVPSPPPASQSSAGGDLSGMKALIVDDDFRNIFALTALLERGRVEVISAESGEEGIATLKRTPDLDIVLMDIMMPVMDGYATMRAMRKLPLAADLPIVAITANVSAGERQRCIDAGASAYIPKPVDTTELLLLLSEWLPGITRAAQDGADSD
jgi:CheY-like chemotaxis protein